MVKVAISRIKSTIALKNDLVKEKRVKLKNATKLGRMPHMV
jgi:hypothetical protein